MRVDDPFRLADVVLPNWSEDRLKKLIGKGERTIRLPEKLPVHLAYFTAFVDDGGTYRTLPDLYGYDAPMRAALGLPGGGGPAIARLPDEPPRRKAERAPKPPATRTVHRRAPERPVADADAWPTGRYEEADAPRRPLRRAARADSAPEYGEPGLWTPAPQQAAPRGWW
ncbi:peptidoglycan binding protein [Methylobacterium sp. ME121]|nr:peptidoglycan binding protein [Methylobacterium sp. ME121]